MLKIVNYGVGNILAFQNVFQRLGIDCESATTEEQISSATKLILPGVGAFDHAMSSFNNSGLRDSVEAAVIQRKIPILGICVGMQMLGDGSEEGELDGLGWIPGRVKKFESSNGNIQIPHMGWNNVQKKINVNVLFDGMDENPEFYFLHSYYFIPQNKEYSAASCDYGTNITIAIAKENVFGVQFHPEKSHSNGQRLLQNFANLQC